MTPIEDPKKERVFQPTPVEKMFEPPVPTLGVGLSGMGRVIADVGLTRDPGVITAESAKATAGNDVVRSGGVYGTMDVNGVNEIMARENSARQSMIDSQRTDLVPGANAASLGDGGVAAANAEKTSRWRQDELLSKAMRNPAAGRIAEVIADGQNRLAVEDVRQQGVMRGQDLSHSAQLAQQGITARGQDLNYQSDQNRNAVAIRGQDITAAEVAQRIGIQQADSNRASEKWGIEKGIMQGQAEDSAATRKARADLTAAIESGDPAKISAAREKAVAAGIKFDKPNNEFTAVTDSMGMNITRTNKDTGAVDIIDGKTGAVKASIPAPGQRPVQQAAPASAIDYLKKNPTQAAAFKAKYGYLPEGF